MNLIKKLRKLIPKDASELELEVNSVPSFLGDLGIGITDDFHTSAGVWYRGKTKAGKSFEGHTRCGIWRTYGNYVRGCVQACAYFSASGVNTSLVDSKATGEYVAPWEIGAESGDPYD